MQFIVILDSSIEDGAGCPGTVGRAGLAAAGKGPVPGTLGSALFWGSLPPPGPRAPWPLASALTKPMPPESAHPALGSQPRAKALSSGPAQPPPEDFPVRKRQ